MKIIDDKKLISSKFKDVLIKISKNHPSGENLYNSINNLIIKPSDGSTEAIYFDTSKKEAILYVFEETTTGDDFEYIICHEFFHIADRINPKFEYSDKKKDLLTEESKRCVMELWNLYIDTRLNENRLLKIRRGSSLLKINGKYQIIYNRTIDTKLMESTNFLKTRGVNNAKNIVREIWGKPNEFLSYEEIINIIKKSKKDQGYE